MADHAQLLKEAYRAFVDNDVESLGGLFSEDAVWHVAGIRPASGDYRGREQVLRFLQDLHDRTEDRFLIEVHDILTDEEHAVVLAHTTARRGEAMYTADEVHVFHFDDAGRISEAWGFSSDPEGQGRFFF